MEEQLSLGMLIDLMDEEWIQDTLPEDEIVLPTVAIARTEDTEDSNEDNQVNNADTWHDLSLGTTTMPVLEE